ncbi:monocarboxylate permease [Aspergillus fischeri NRRL 181]|uniref:Monocarboxylate permease homologue, mch4 n=1 Tax=Neosartorya fischeri (strain ATCC 1020 / DSM 3700 / CBS 544.65 / FGSC A1164 / JCM 1740 / NRRL 181 / WB 181) TaxID=331117 RepID=A1D4T5_NEOFI|nr:monocarboxylate permease homologue, mch4 [Aspergillus fischeri NRRL 181]EAW23428.1 monocarboxylate permease homologue, mch4 [Aspergillus fischeri NRRL 181]
MSGTTDQSPSYDEEPQLHHHISSDKDHEPENTPENMSTNNPAPDGGIRAWFVAGGAASIFLCTLGLANSFGTFEQYYLSHQLKGDSASKISWIGSLQSFLQFFAGMLGGPLFDRYGSMVIYPSSVAYVFALIMLSLCKTYWDTMLVQGVLMGIVMGFLQIPAFAAVSQYFDRKRAAALGLAVSGSSIGGIILPIILSKMLNDSSLGFAWTVRIVGFIILPFMAFASLAVKPRLPPRKTRLFLLSPYKDIRFIMLLISLFFMFFGMFTPFFYLTTYATTRGMDAALAGYLLAIVNATSTLGRIIPGILADKYGRLNTFALGGVATGIIDVGTYMGMGMAVAGLGALIGPPINGAIFDASGGFFQVCMFSGAMAVVGGLVAFAGKSLTSEGLLGWV